MPDCLCDLSRCVPCDEARDAELRRTFPTPCCDYFESDLALYGEHFHVVGGERLDPRKVSPSKEKE